MNSLPAPCPAFSFRARERLSPTDDRRHVTRAQAASTRLLTVGWWIFSLTVMATYFVNLKSFLSTSIRPTAFHIATEPADLIMNPDFRFGVVAHGATYSFLNVSVNH